MHPKLRWRVEVPVPIVGDRRSGDAVIDDGNAEILVEAETHLDDIQGLERRLSAKARDLGVKLSLLLVADTRHNRQVVRLHGELRRRFPLDTRAALRSLLAGQLPTEGALVIL